MKRHLTFKEILFILPILVIISVFSIWPILDSVKYTVFDYRLNDQQKSKMFLGSRFNTETFSEDVKYISFYLKKDKALVEDETEVKEFERIMAYVKAMEDKYVDQKAIIELDKSDLKELENFMSTVKQDVQALYDRNASQYGLNNKVDLTSIIDGLRKSLIKSNYIGLESYKAVFSDERFGIALGNTLYFTVISVILEFGLGLGLAMIMNKAMKGIGIVRTISLIPWAIPTAVSALIWSYMYDGSSGIVAKILTSIGIVDSPEQLLLTSSGAMACAIIADVWKTTPYMALLLLGGLQTIDRGLYESSQIDGAGKIRSFLSITMPLLKPSILVAILFRTLDAFRVYDLIAVLTGGGPGGSTETLSIYAYKIMFGQTNFGYGSVIVMMMFLCVAAIAILFVKVLGTDLMSKN